MAMFGMKKARTSEGTELILAYLEEAQRLRVPFTILDSRGRTLSGLLATVAEDKVTMSTQGLPMPKGTDVDLVFVLDGLRLKASTKIQESKPGSATLELPSRLALAEQRKRPRARLNAREGATAIALTGLFDGVGINGTIDNISEGGVCIRVDRAMEVKTQRKMAMSASLLPVGTQFMLVKMSKLPKCPPVELGGRVAWIDTNSGLLVGIAFESGKEALLAPIKAFVSGRTTAIPTSVPPKARRPPESDRPAEERPAPKKEAEVAAAPVAATPVPTPVAPTPAPPAPKPEPAPAPVQDERAQALLRVKKRARGILLAMPEGPDRSAVATFLGEDGYGRVLCADTLTDLLEQTGRPGIHLILVDGGVAELQGLALASLLRHSMEDGMPPLILAEDSVDAELVLGAQETGVAQILVKPYDLDLDFRRMIEGHLGLG